MDECEIARERNWLKDIREEMLKQISAYEKKLKEFGMTDREIQKLYRCHK